MADAQLLVPMIDAFDALDASLRDLAYELVGRVFAEELNRRRADEAAEEAEAVARSAATRAADEADAEPSPTRTSGGPPRRGPWTRDQVVSELASWLLGGNPVEAAFLARHGQRALVTNAKRHFGRFEAALNAANLHLAKQYPEGIPSKKKSLKS